MADEFTPLFFISLLDHVLHIRSERNILQFFSGEPADLFCVVRGLQFARYPAAKKIDKHIVVTWASMFVAYQSVIDSQQLTGCDGKPCLFSGLAHYRFAQSFAEFQNASWDGPVSQQRRMASSGQDDTIPFDDNRAHAHKWTIRIFSFHGCHSAKFKTANLGAQSAGVSF